MTPDLYGAWRTAGDNLQPVAAWLAAHWTGLAALGIAIGVLTVLGWAFRGDDYRSRNDRRQAAWAVVRGERPEPAEPGVDDTLLAACQQILAATNSRKEER